ncbi:hypothetical protein WME99_18025 [Sorangium sp. So ce136]|uniref:hypothetical protein n=1 Tax=Sorangium sp. So ce136 TaxID=3133284 RepID=UPI003F0A6BFE
MSNVALIERLYRAVREKDQESFRSVCAPDLEWIQNEGLDVDGHHQLHQVERVAAGRPGALDDVHAAVAHQRRVLASLHGRERTTRAQATQAIISSGDAPAST